jgi:hypothetical protein
LANNFCMNSRISDSCWLDIVPYLIETRRHPACVQPIHISLSINPGFYPVSRLRAMRFMMNAVPATNCLREES